MIPLDKMPLIEKKLKIRITVNGDATYQSQYDSKNELHLVLSNNHYTLFVDKKHYTRSSFSDRKILITHEVEDGYRVSTKDGSAYYYILFISGVGVTPGFTLPLYYRYLQNPCHFPVGNVKQAHTPRRAARASKGA
ncbi:hypothetical protein PAPYR_12647 [Paratrimastix pyriformis]|uniref:Uncharacterized protein n=1 Tax=Paratrimastix pyriformis TaxID=342808 RepID=A0ABQ8U1J0_9EUKA|nr:hypothetical protein PAPYR_12647 [Paratrimastix pyriformis]